MGVVPRQLRLFIWSASWPPRDRVDFDPSAEGQGSTFGFTLVPYSQLADEAKNSDSHADVTRTAHGWIKNHSLYRR